MEILYQDTDIIVCVKPPRVLSTDEPGGMPELVREALGDPNANVRTGKNGFKTKGNNKFLIFENIKGLAKIVFAVKPRFSFFIELLLIVL